MPKLVDTTGGEQQGPVIADASPLSRGLTPQTPFQALPSLTLSSKGGHGAAWGGSNVPPGTGIEIQSGGVKDSGDATSVQPPENGDVAVGMAVGTVVRCSKKEGGGVDGVSTTGGGVIMKGMEEQITPRVWQNGGAHAKVSNGSAAAGNLPVIVQECRNPTLSAETLPAEPHSTRDGKSAKSGRVATLPQSVKLLPSPQQELVPKEPAASKPSAAAKPAESPQPVLKSQAEPPIGMPLLKVAISANIHVAQVSEAANVTPQMVSNLPDHPPLPVSELTDTPSSIELAAPLPPKLTVSAPSDPPRNSETLPQVSKPATNLDSETPKVADALPSCVPQATANTLPTASKTAEQPLFVLSTAAISPPPESPKLKKAPPPKGSEPAQSIPVRSSQSKDKLLGENPKLLSKASNVTPPPLNPKGLSQPPEEVQTRDLAGQPTPTPESECAKVVAPISGEKHKATRGGGGENDPEKSPPGKELETAGMSAPAKPVALQQGKAAPKGTISIEGAATEWRGGAEQDQMVKVAEKCKTLDSSMADAHPASLPAKATSAQLPQQTTGVPVANQDTCFGQQAPAQPKQTRDEVTAPLGAQQAQRSSQSDLPRPKQAEKVRQPGKRKRGNKAVPRETSVEGGEQTLGQSATPGKDTPGSVSAVGSQGAKGSATAGAKRRRTARVSQSTTPGSAEANKAKRVRGNVRTGRQQVASLCRLEVGKADGEDQGASARTTSSSMVDLDDVLLSARVTGSLVTGTSSVKKPAFVGTFKRKRSAPTKRKRSSRAGVSVIPPVAQQTSEKSTPVSASHPPAARATAPPKQNRGVLKRQPPPKKTPHASSAYVPSGRLAPPFPVSVIYPTPGSEGCRKQPPPTPGAKPSLRAPEQDHTPSATKNALQPRALAATTKTLETARSRQSVTEASSEDSWLDGSKLKSLAKCLEDTLRQNSPPRGKRLGQLQPGGQKMPVTSPPREGAERLPGSRSGNDQPEGGLGDASAALSVQKNGACGLVSTQAVIPSVRSSHLSQGDQTEAPAAVVSKDTSLVVEPPPLNKPSLEVAEQPRVSHLVTAPQQSLGIETASKQAGQPKGAVQSDRRGLVQNMVAVGKANLPSKQGGGQSEKAGMGSGTAGGGSARAGPATGTGVTSVEKEAASVTAAISVSGVALAERKAKESIRGANLATAKQTDGTPLINAATKSASPVQHVSFPKPLLISAVSPALPVSAEPDASLLVGAIGGNAYALDHSSELPIIPSRAAREAATCVAEKAAPQKQRRIGGKGPGTAGTGSSTAVDSAPAGGANEVPRKKKDTLEGVTSGTRGGDIGAGEVAGVQPSRVERILPVQKAVSDPRQGGSNELGSKQIGLEGRLAAIQVLPAGEKDAGVKRVQPHSVPTTQARPAQGDATRSAGPFLEGDRGAEKVPRGLPSPHLSPRGSTQGDPVREEEGRVRRGQVNGGQPVLEDSPVSETTVAGSATGSSQVTAVHSPLGPPLEEPQTAQGPDALLEGACAPNNTSPVVLRTQLDLTKKVGALNNTFEQNSSSLPLQEGGQVRKGTRHNLPSLELKSFLDGPPHFDSDDELRRLDDPHATFPGSPQSIPFLSGDQPYHHQEDQTLEQERRSILKRSFSDLDVPIGGGRQRPRTRHHLSMRSTFGITLPTNCSMPAEPRELASSVDAHSDGMGFQSFREDKESPTFSTSFIDQDMEALGSAGPSTPRVDESSSATLFPPLKVLIKRGLLATLTPASEELRASCLQKELKDRPATGGTKAKAAMGGRKETCPPPEVVLDSLVEGRKRGVELLSLVDSRSLGKRRIKPSAKVQEAMLSGVLSPGIGRRELVETARGVGNVLWGKIGTVRQDGEEDPSGQSQWGQAMEVLQAEAGSRGHREARKMLTECSGGDRGVEALRPSGDVGCLGGDRPRGGRGVLPENCEAGFGGELLKERDADVQPSGGKQTREKEGPASEFVRGEVMGVQTGIDGETPVSLAKSANIGGPDKNRQTAEGEMIRDSSGLGRDVEDQGTEKQLGSAPQGLVTSPSSPKSALSEQEPSAVSEPPARGGIGQSLCGGGNSGAKLPIDQAGPPYCWGESGIGFSKEVTLPPALEEARGEATFKSAPTEGVRKLFHGELEVQDDKLRGKGQLSESENGVGRESAGFEQGARLAVGQCAEMSRKRQLGEGGGDLIRPTKCRTVDKRCGRSNWGKNVHASDSNSEVVFMSEAGLGDSDVQQTTIGPSEHDFLLGKSIYVNTLTRAGVEEELLTYFSETVLEDENLDEVSESNLRARLKAAMRVPETFEP